MIGLYIRNTGVNLSVNTEVALSYAPLRERGGGTPVK